VVPPRTRMNCEERDDSREKSKGHSARIRIGSVSQTGCRGFGLFLFSLFFLENVGEIAFESLPTLELLELVTAVLHNSSNNRWRSHHSQPG